MSDYDFTYLSLGAGVQSSALFVMSALGMYDCPKATAAIFADTQAEPAWVYEHLAHLQAFGEQHGLPVHVVTKGSLTEKVAGTKTIPLPAWVASPGSPGKKGQPLMRSCTEDYKILPVRKEAKRLLGYRPGQRVKKLALQMLGISTDEAQRMRDSKIPWIENSYPLIDAGMDRQACKELLAGLDLPTPERSACVYCPFHGRDFWRNLKRHHPDEWERVLVVDDLLRRDGGRKLKAGPAYLTPLLKPMRDLDLDSKQLDLFDAFGNECEGMCGV